MAPVDGGGPDGEGDDDEPGLRSPDDWAALFHRLTSGEFGGTWTYSDVAGLTFPQLRNVLREGKTPEDPRAKERAALATLEAFRDGRITF